MAVPKVISLSPVTINVRRVVHPYETDFVSNSYFAW